MKQRRRLALGTVLQTGMLLVEGGRGAPAAAAQRAADPAAHLVVPFPAGGPTDMVARPLAQFLGERLKQQIIVDNRGGASGGIGAELVAKAPAEGYTLLMTTVGPHAINARI